MLTYLGFCATLSSKMETGAMTAARMRSKSRIGTWQSAQRGKEN